MTGKSARVGLNEVCLQMAANDGGIPPILAQKHYARPSAFTPENLLREARRQKQIAPSSIPEICVLDPDGDILRSLLARGEARLDKGWACYHTQLCTFSRDGIEFGIVGCAVGASFAVLIAEEMFASGCKLLISVTLTLARCLPIADQRLEGRERRERRGVGTQHARSQTDGANKREFLEGVKFRLGEAPFRPGEHGLGTRRRAAQRLGDRRRCPAFVA